MRCSLVLLALAASVFAEDLATVLGQDQDLSMLLSILSTLPDFMSSMGSMSNITLLAPTNEAFEAVGNDTPLGQAMSTNDTAYIDATIAYHVLNGNYTSKNVTDTPMFVHSSLNSSLQLNGQPAANVTGGQFVEILKNGDTVTVLSGALAESNVTQADIMADGVTIHKINRVLALPDTVSGTALAAGQNVAVAALILANLADTINNAEDITIFVPENQAFSEIGSALLAASPMDLSSILEYHVVNGTVLFTTEASNDTVKSFEGTDINVNVADDEIFVNQARVVVPNIIVRNGVAHLINAVLNPNSTNVDTKSLSTSGTPTPAFSGASSTDLPFTSTVTAPASTIVIPAIVTNAPQASSSGGNGNGGSSSSSSSSGNAGAPMVTAAANLVGAGLFMAGAFII